MAHPTNDSSLDTKPEKNASFQILSGHHIGRLLPLNKTISLFDRNETGTVTITKEKDGYFISTSENNSDVTINQEPLPNEPVLLNHNDIVNIDNIPMQFFL